MKATAVLEGQFSTKRMAIDKARTQMVAIVALAAFITVFSLIASKAVFSQDRYQGRVIGAKQQAHKQLVEDISAYNDLITHYQVFDGASTNVIGGSAGGTGDNDGKNSKIILDALPPTYDFPALTSSIEKIMHDRNLKISDFSGTDDQVNQQNNQSSPTPQAVPMPFSFTIQDASYSSIQQLIDALQHSIRPIIIDNLSLSGGSSKMDVTVNAHTYYQPSKKVNITTKVVK